MGGGLILAIETSCDETAVAVAEGESGEILISKVASQIDLHSPYGGVVPELASRNHSLDLKPLIQTTLKEGGIHWSDLSGVAATSGPGLASSLLVGDTTAKAIAAGLGCEFFSINHMEGHLLSPFIGQERTVEPHVALIVSGGHTMLVGVDGVGQYRLLGTTKDDAAGEAFDKVGKMLGLPYPGGPQIARHAAKGRCDAYDFPRSMMDSGDFQFSFSGLKTSALYLLKKLGGTVSDEVLEDFCASFQESIVDVLVSKLIRAAAQEGCGLIAISGGVSCNQRLQQRARVEAEQSGLKILIPDAGYSTDNAAMIAFAAAMRNAAGIKGSSLSSDIDPNLKLA